MISVNDFKTGVIIEYDSSIWRIIDFQQIKPDKGAAFVRSKLKNLRSGLVQEKTFCAGEKVAKAQINNGKMQYLYESAGNHVFMDLENYEQIELSTERIKDELKFLLENSLCTIEMYGTEIIGVSLPDVVELKVVETESGNHGATPSGGVKLATMATGLVVQVPFFINEGDILVIKTDDGSYVSRA